MSVIYGIVALNGSPVKQEMLESMKRAMEFTHPDSEALWQNGSVAIGSLIKYDTPESFKEKQPIFFEDDHKILVATARIDNRDELCSIFNIPLIYRDNYPDSHYIKLAYEKWGESSPDHLLGDWSFAVYDKVTQKLFVARDHCGIMACYYYSCADFFAFSSSPKGLLALKEIPKEINEFRIAQVLVAWPGDGEQTAYQNILNLKPGCYLTIQGKEVKRTLYWELTEQEDLILPREQDYYDRFLEIFTEAVRCRLRTTKQVGISLSGGLDSTSIAAIAAIELAKQNKELFAFTSVPLYKDYKVPKHRNGDEGELAGLMAKKYPNIRHFLVNAEGYDPIECIKKAVEIQDEPMHAASNQYWIQAINDKAKEFDVDILLTGQGGNGVISWPSSKARLYKQTGILSFKYYLKNIIQLTYEYVFEHQIYKYPFLKYSAISPEFVKRLNLMKAMEQVDYDFRRRKVYPFKMAQCKLISLASPNVYPSHFKKSLWFGINSADPSNYIHLMNFVLSVPLNIHKKYGYDRVMVKQAMKDYLPREIIASNLRGFQGADINKRIKTKQFDILHDQQDVEYLRRDMSNMFFNPAKFSKDMTIFFLNRFNSIN